MPEQLRRKRWRKVTVHGAHLGLAAADAAVGAASRWKPGAVPELCRLLESEVEGQLLWEALEVRVLLTLSFFFQTEWVGLSYDS